MQLQEWEIYYQDEEGSSLVFVVYFCDGQLTGYQDDHDHCVILILGDESRLLIGWCSENVGGDHEESAHAGRDLEESDHVHFVCVLCP